ncbi:hypothetical protein BD779DRAFT_927774 [Infundibulicybe gibba]|nr:hypothetical protein BD779DRAFT_927774 [Infundibulicybe gibba]
MKFLLFAVALSLLFSIASAGIITDTRREILATWNREYEASKKVEKPPATELSLVSIDTPGWNAPTGKSRFTELTVDRLSKAVPNVNIIVVHGKHQHTDINGHVDRYDESIWIRGREFKYTVILFHGGKLTMQDKGGASNLRIYGKWKKSEGKNNEWIFQPRVPS